MKIDNSGVELFEFCPAAYFERYVNKREPNWTALGRESPYEFGKLFHQFLENYYGNQPLPTASGAESSLFLDVRELFEAYRSFYPTDREIFEVVETERYFEVPLPGSKHILNGKIDMLIRMLDSGRLRIFETKTEKRNSKKNSPKRWAVRAQGPLYQYAGTILFGEQDFEGTWVNVCTRPSEAKQKPPDFRRDLIPFDQSRVDKAVEDVISVADEIERAVEVGRWRFHNEHCVDAMTGWECDYNRLHVIGESPEILSKFQEAEEYLGAK